MKRWHGAAGWALGIAFAAGVALAGEKARHDDTIADPPAPQPEVLEAGPYADEGGLDEDFVRRSPKDPDRYDFPTKGFSFKPPEGYRLSAVNPYAAEKVAFASFRREDAQNGPGYFYFYESTRRINRTERNISLAKTVDSWRERFRRNDQIARPVGGIRNAGRGWKLAILEVNDTEERAREKNRQGALSAWLDALFVKESQLLEVRFLTRPEHAKQLMPAAREAIERLEFITKAKEK